MRHGHRIEARQGSFGNDLALTLEGKKASENLGAQSKVLWGEVHTSPILRCVQTSEEILKGAHQTIPIMTTKVLGDPGPFIEDPEIAGPVFLEKPLLQIAQTLVDGKTRIPGMRSLEEGGKLFLEYVLKVKYFPCLMITHDIVICLLCCFFLESNEVHKYLPAFLEGFVLDVKTKKVNLYHPHR